MTIAPAQPASPPSEPYQTMAEAARIFKALGDPVRLRLYLQIAARLEPVCVCDLTDVGVPPIHRLRKLREAGLIDCERRGTWVYYWLLTTAVHSAQQLIGLGLKTPRVRPTLHTTDPVTSHRRPDQPRNPPDE